MVNQITESGAGGGSTVENSDAAYLPKTLSDINDAKDDGYLDDGLTKEEKLFALGRLDSTGRCRSAPNTAVVSLHTYEQASERVIAGPLQLHIGWVCQAGFYPENLNKANQDNLLVSTNLKRIQVKQVTSGRERVVEKELSIFGVFDGHGAKGTECSTFAVEQFCAVFNEAFGEQTTKGPVTIEQIQRCITCSLIEVNKQMHKQKYNRTRKPPLDDTLSGTTAVVVFVLDDTVLVANVGDSRAIVASSNNGVLEAHNLSVDQTPFRKDERKRCQEAGAVVMTSDQLEGYKPYDASNEDFGNEEDDGEDPPRLWLPNSGSPGVAFTRSLGDELAESIGCIAEPELLNRSILATDRFIVIASDGVFEFLTSQLVVDVVSQFTDAQQAAKALVAEAYKLWLHYEVRTDDITAIVICFSGNEGYQAVAKSIPDEKMYEEEARPVRTKISKAKRKLLQKNEDDAAEHDEDLADATIEIEPKTEAELKTLRDAIRVNFFFHHLSESKIEDVLKAFKKMPFNAGDTLIRQGERGDLFYVLQTGKLEVYVEAETEVDGEILTTKQLMTEYEPGVVNPSFGEQALMHSEPRTASVIARTDGVAWGLNRPSFRRAMKTVCNKDIVQALSKVPILETLSRSQLQRLAANVTEEVFHPKDVIIRQGEFRETFYVVKGGTVRCTINDKVATRVHQQKQMSSRRVLGNASKAADTSLVPSPPKEKRNVELLTKDMQFDPHAAREVMRIEKGGYFGEQALLKDEPRGASVIAVEETTCFVINRSGFEQILGPLSSLLHSHSRKRQINARGKQQMAQNRLRLELEKDICVQELKLKAIVTASDSVRIAMVTLSGGRPFVVKTYFKSASEANDLCKQAENDRLLSLFAGVHDPELQQEIHHHAQEAERCKEVQCDSALLPALVSTFVGLNGVHMLYDIDMCAPMYSFMEHPLEESTAKFAAACVYSIINSLHSKLVLCRSLNPSSLMINRKGYVCLVELGFGKWLDDSNDRTYTICGDPAYLSPEALFHKGHGLSSDWWAMGVFVYEMLMASLPFDDTEDEIDGFSKIVKLDSKLISYQSISAEGADFIQLLLEQDPDQRMTNSASLTSHPWLANYDIDQISSAAAVSPLMEDVQAKLTALEAASGDIDSPADQKPQPGLWFESFCDSA